MWKADNTYNVYFWTVNSCSLCSISTKSFMVRLRREHCAHMRLLSPLNMPCRKTICIKKTLRIEVWYPIKYDYMMMIKNRITNKIIVFIIVHKWLVDGESEILCIGRPQSNTYHHSGVIMNAMMSPITGVSVVCRTVCSGADHQSSASLTFVWEYTGDRWIPAQRASNAENVWWRHVFPLYSLQLY